MHRLLLKARYSNTIIIIISILIFLLLALILELYNYYRITANYKREVNSASAKVIDKVDYIFDQANLAAQNMLLAKDKPCYTEEYKLKKLVASSDVIRSATITYNGIIYCSSVYELVKQNTVNVEDYINKEITLFKSNHLTPNSPILTYSLKDGDWAAFVAMHGKVVADILGQSQFRRESIILINDMEISVDNMAITSRLPHKRHQLLTFKSDKYPYSMVVNFSAIKNNYRTVLSFIILTITLLVLGIITFLYIAMTASKRQFKRAIVDNELIPYYQLIISTADYQWHGLEVLTRWQHPKHGLITPDKFISLAERTKLIIPMTKILMARVAEELIPYIYSLPKPFYISFNVHASHFDDPELLVDCQQFLDAFPEDTVNLVLELTESQFIKNTSSLDKLLTKFHDLGVTISIDDFGTGYSNLGYLQKYKIDNLKIDRMFIANIYKKTTSHYLLDTIIDLGKHMDLKIVAEGVETFDQLNYLTTQGVEYIQGFLFSRPVPIQDMIRLLIKPYKLPILDE